MEEENKKQKLFILITGILLLAIAVIGVSYAFAEVVLEGSQENEIRSGAITFIYTEPTSSVTMSTNMPISDNDGRVLNDYFPFAIQASATGNVNIGYYIYFTLDANNSISNDDVKIYLASVANADALVASETLVSGPALISSFPTFSKTTLAYDSTAPNYYLHSNYFTFSGDSTTQYHYYRLRLWLNEDYITSSTDINITGTGPTDTTHQAVIGSETFKIIVNVYAVDGTPTAITIS